ncbi:hypothetical protein BCAR13_80092 [Paraburkholderia caribensis]|nr:hypothetical protein BCAR13_80092 [Paraburkholderia caribensis]
MALTLPGLCGRGVRDASKGRAGARKYKAGAAPGGVPRFFAWQLIQASRVFGDLPDTRSMRVRGVHLPIVMAMTRACDGLRSARSGRQCHLPVR